MEKLYGNKEEISQLFGVNIKTLNNDLTNMRRNPNFSPYVLRVSHKRTNVNVLGYEKYLQYKAENFTKGYL
ncbi:DNA-binding protein [Lactococcus lactis]|uniref:DNA-binding protein n=1 Tax=Lactococcus lactis TaxID=1358 RepID=UPI0035614E08